MPITVVIIDPSEAISGSHLKASATLCQEGFDPMIPPTNIDVTASELAFSQAELLTCGTVYLSLSYLPACLPLNGL